jgi:adenosine deaminase
MADASVEAKLGESKLSVTEDLIRKLPKTDLHVHLDGSMPIKTLIELAKERKITLPTYTEEGFLETVFLERYKDLGEYLHGFKYTTAVLQDPESLERTAYDLAWDNINEGVYYIEPRFAPQLHIGPGRDFVDVVSAVNKGLDRAKNEYNSKKEVVDGKLPPFEYGIIVCAMRMFTEGFSNYYGQLFEVHPSSKDKEVFAMASIELARAAVQAIHEHGLPIVGFDLAGQENGYPASDHIAAYQYAHKHFLMKTVHAGEAYGPESIFQAITDLHADRLGHGYHLFSQSLIENPKIDKEKYCEDLAAYIADRRVTIEVCLTSNLQTNPAIQSIEDHAFKEMKKRRMSATFCTDNRTVSRTTVTKELMLATNAFSFTERELHNYIIYGFKRSFFPSGYTKKRNFVRMMSSHYEKIMAEYQSAQ